MLSNIIYSVILVFYFIISKKNLANPVNESFRHLKGLARIILFCDLFNQKFLFQTPDFVNASP